MRKHVSTKRLRIDIGDLWLEKVPGLQLQGPVYAGGKHLCGAATDLTLRCLDRSVFHVGAESVAQHSSLSNPDDSYEMATCPLHCDSYQEKKSSIDKLSSVSSSSSCQKLFTNELTSRQERRHCAANTHDSSRCESSPSSHDSVLVKACGNSNHRCGSQHREGVDDGTLSSSQKTRSSHETEEAAKCRPSRGLVIALCCHHKCSWQHYVGKKFFKSIGLSGEDFPAVMGLTSWAVCAARPPAGATGDGGAGATGDGGAGATGDGGAGATGDGGAGATGDGGAGDSGSSASLATTGGDLDELPAASNMNARKIPKDLERIYSSDAPKVSFDATGLSVLSLSEHNTEQTGSTEQAGRSEQTGSSEQAGSSVTEESEALNAQCVSHVQSVNSKRKKSFENVNYKFLKMITHKDSVSDASFGPFVSAGEDSSEHATVTEGAAARNRYVRLGLSISEREEIGRAAKHIIDYGRVDFLRSRGLNATLIQKTVILHDNTRPHAANVAQEKFLLLGWSVLPHPPYSPDLSQTDFHLHSTLQNALQSRKFTEDNQFENGFTRDYYLHILVLPLLLVACFGLVSVAIIGYRVYSFNDCKEAAQELQLQIEEAKKDLVSKGFKFERNS
ncbi:Dolichol-phosphate mannosyltransferase subunit 3 [Trinorchestia longiramus]|nr:Dolichol-phosphate mannosyltransferase subunit 3 [Trinorchestia longiramus]